MKEGTVYKSVFIHLNNTKIDHQKWLRKQEKHTEDNKLKEELPTKVDIFYLNRSSATIH